MYDSSSIASADSVDDGSMLSLAMLNSPPSPLLPS